MNTIRVEHVLKYISGARKRFWGWFLIHFGNRKFLKDSSLLLLANAIVTVLGMIRTPAMTWIIPKEEIGMLGVIASWLPFVEVLSLPGMNSACYHYVAKGNPWAYITATYQRLRWSLLSSGLLLIGAVFWYCRGNIPLTYLFSITAITFPITIGLTTTSSIISAQERFKGLFWYRIADSITDFAGFIPLLFSVFIINRIVTFYSTNQISTAIMQIGLSILLYVELKRKNTIKMDIQSSSEMIRYSKHLTALSGLSVVQARSDSMFVGLVLPLNTMADYSIANMVSEQLKRLWSIYIALRYPPLVRMPTANRIKQFMIEGLFLFSGFIFAGGILALAAYIFIPILLPPEYSDSIIYSYVLIATIISAIPGWMIEQYFRTEQDERQQYIMRISATAMSLVAPLVLIFIFDAYGAALGRLIANLSLSIIGLYLFIKAIRKIKIAGDSSS